MLILQDVHYAHPNREPLFHNINLSINAHEKVALIGSNGVGKSVLLRLMAGILSPVRGVVRSAVVPYHVPQVLGQYDHFTVAQALQVQPKLDALSAILAGDVTESNMEILNDDWTIEDRCHEALTAWGLDGISLAQPMGALSGGQKTKVLLAGIGIHSAGLALLDEPGNHLDAAGRALLTHYIAHTSDTLVVVSHDRALLQLLSPMVELTHKGLSVYGGNYELYTAQKAIENNALQQDLRSAEKALRKAKETEREAIQRQQKLDAKGKKKQEKAGVPTIAMNTLRNSAENSTARMKDVHAQKVAALADEGSRLRDELPGNDKMRLGFHDSTLHTGKILLRANEINLQYGAVWLWPHPLTLELRSGERVLIRGNNGSGKTSLVKLLLGSQEPTIGEIVRTDINTVYIDQDYSLLSEHLSVYEQAQQFNTGKLADHELKSRLTHFLFTPEYWQRSCAVLSGGERMRLVLCCLSVAHTTPDIIVLDEPTNNLDIQNMEILTNAINQYRGTLVIISHDGYFVGQVGISRELLL